MLEATVRSPFETVGSGEAAVCSTPMASVEGIFIAQSAGAAPRAVAEVTAIPGRGLEGDRYFAGGGTFFEERKEGQDLTLIEAEAIEALAREHGIELGPGESRRNVVTRGIGLNELVGRRLDRKSTRLNSSH